MPFGLCSVIAEKLALLSCRVSSAMIRLALQQCTTIWFRCFCSVTDCFHSPVYFDIHTANIVFSSTARLLQLLPGVHTGKVRQRLSPDQNTSNVGFINNLKETSAVSLVNKQRANTRTVAAAHLSCYQFPPSPEKLSLYTPSMPLLTDLLEYFNASYFDETKHIIVNEASL